MNILSGKHGTLALVTLAAVVFTLALTFATLELPLRLGSWLAGYFPDINPAIEPDRVEEFVRQVRPLGYACLALIIVLIFAGFVTRKRNLSLLGSAAFFLPTFGYFFASMFFLAGLGIVRVPFIPFWDSPVQLIKLGDIVYLPYMATVYPFWLAGIDVRVAAAWVTVGLGLFIFIFGTITWFYGKTQKLQTINFWIYRYSRHPQYLGFIIWSYGVMLIAAQQPVVRGGENPGASLPWLLSSLAVICVALAEEISMSKADRENYGKYRSGPPFLFQVPSWMTYVLTLPVRIFLGKPEPETGREVAAVFFIYAVIYMLLSLPFVLLNWPPGLGWSDWPAWLISLP